jgi:hypothetical protein
MGIGMGGPRSMVGMMKRPSLTEEPNLPKSFEGEIGHVKGLSQFFSGDENGLGRMGSDSTTETVSSSPGASRRGSTRGRGRGGMSGGAGTPGVGRAM